MANGILKSQAEYYQDDVTYTGNPGTTTNKYVIEDVFDLCTTSTSGGSSNPYFEMVADVDFNDHPDYKFGVNKIIFGGGQNGYFYLEGNGHRIRNLVIKNSTATIFNVDSISNVRFENLVLIGTTSGALCRRLSGNVGVESVCDATSVSIGCYIFDSASTVIFDNNTKKVMWNNCSFNIKGKTTDGCNLDGGSGSHTTTYTNCHINIDITTSSATCISTKNMIFDNSYITGIIKTTDESNVFGFNGNGSTLKNSYFAVSIIADDAIDVQVNPWAIVSSVSFVDVDLLPDKFVEHGIDNLYYLTTEQATDPDYLLSIGFPVVSV